MEATKVEYTLETVQSAHRRLKALKRTFRDMLADDGVMCGAEASEFWDELVSLREALDECLERSRQAYVAKRAADAFERGAGFEFSAYHRKEILAPANVAPIEAGMNVTELYPQDGPRAA